MTVVHRTWVAMLALVAIACGGESAPPSSAAPPSTAPPSAAPPSAAPPPPTTEAAPPTPPPPAPPTPMPLGACRFVPEGGLALIAHRQAPHIVATQSALAVAHVSETDRYHDYGISSRVWNEDVAIVPLPLAAPATPITAADPVPGEDLPTALFTMGDDVAYAACEVPTGGVLTCRLGRSSSAATPVSFGLAPGGDATIEQIGAGGTANAAWVGVITHPGQDLIVFAIHPDGTVAHATITTELPFPCGTEDDCDIAVRAESDERAIVSVGPAMSPPYEVTVGADGAATGEARRTFSAPVRIGWDLRLAHGHTEGHSRTGVWIAGADPVAIDGLPVSNYAAEAAPWHDGWLLAYDTGTSAARSQFARIALTPTPHVVGDVIPAPTPRDNSRGGPSVATVGDHAYVAWEAGIPDGREVRVAELVCDEAPAPPPPP